MATTSGRTSAVELAYHHVKGRILVSSFDSGFFLTEGQIGGELEISRTPVREAFHRLESEGLLKIIPKKGAWVPPISRREIDEVMETRKMIELFCVDKLLRERMPVPVPLGQLLDEQEKLGEAGDVEGFVDCDRRFHLTIVTAIDNSVLASIYESLRDRQLRMGVRAVASTSERSKQVIAEHRDIANAFDRSDLAGMTDAVARHLDSTLAVLHRAG